MFGPGSVRLALAILAWLVWAPVALGQMSALEPLKPASQLQQAVPAQAAPIPVSQFPPLGQVQPATQLQPPGANNGQVQPAVATQGATQPQPTTSTPAAAPAQPAAGNGQVAPDQWRQPNVNNAAAPAGATRQPAQLDNRGGPEGLIEPLKPVQQPETNAVAKVTLGPTTLPNEHGQLWRDYDLTPYTSRVTSTQRPEQAIVDWVLRETGYEAWHGEPLAMLSASRGTLRVYHTPEVHAVVNEVVDRFVASAAAPQSFSLRMVSVGHPNWRAKAQPMLRPIAVQSPGIQAWLMQKEEAALLLGDLRKRMDFREHSSPQLLVQNGQPAVVAATRPRNYVRDLVSRPDVWPGFEAQMGQLDEGFSLEFSPLLSMDGRSVDAMVKCHIDQIEKLIPVSFDVQLPGGQRQSAKIEAPQTSQVRFQERFRWPTDQVLVVGLGVVPSPTPVEQTPIIGNLPFVSSSTDRADLLILIECQGQLSQPPVAGNQTAQQPQTNFSGRY